jgi:hypothetical protein
MTNPDCTASALPPCLLQCEQLRLAPLQAACAGAALRLGGTGHGQQQQQALAAVTVMAVADDVADEECGLIFLALFVTVRCWQALAVCCVLRLLLLMVMMLLAVGCQCR